MGERDAGEAGPRGADYYKTRGDDNKDKQQRQRLDVHLHQDQPFRVVVEGAQGGSGVAGKLDEVLMLLRSSAKRERDMAGEIVALVAEVTQIRTVNDSVLTLIDGIKARLDAAIAAGDMTEVVKATQELSAERQRMADAVVANTPQAPPADPATFRR